MRFADRAEAGRRLAADVELLGLDRPVVLGLPRGGVVVAAEVAAVLGAELDVLVVRKIGVPWQPELGVGALAEGAEPLLDEPLMARVGISRAALERVIAAEREELARRVEVYRLGRPPAEIRDRSVVVVDDGLATGGTARAALRALRGRGAAALILAVPVAAADAVARLRAEADRVVVAVVPDTLSSVGQSSVDFRQTTDAEVVAALDRQARSDPSG